MKVGLKPITINKCWQGRRFKTPEYKNWRLQACMLMRSFPRFEEKRDYQITISAFIKNNTASDIDNLLKPILDAIVEAKIIPDDRYIKRIICEKYKSEEEYFEFEIKEL